MLMIGDPCYQAYRCLDYETQFNNQTDDEKMNTKILLNLPMVPPSKIRNVRLQYLSPVMKTTPKSLGDRKSSKGTNYMSTNVYPGSQQNINTDMPLNNDLI